jgi:hypothetical protein
MRICAITNTSATSVPCNAVNMTLLLLLLLLLLRVRNSSVLEAFIALSCRKHETDP